MSNDPKSATPSLHFKQGRLTVPLFVGSPDEVPGTLRPARRSDDGGWGVLQDESGNVLHVRVDRDADGNLELHVEVQGGQRP